MNPVEIIKAHMQAELADRRSWEEDVQAQIRAAYRALSLEQAEEVARYALDVLDTLSQEREHLALTRLSDLAILVPGSLHPLYPELIRRELFYGDFFSGADTHTRDHLIALVDTSGEHVYSHIMVPECLAWIGDEVVQACFARWRETPPIWWNQTPTDWRHTIAYEPPPIEACTKEAGWELTKEGKRRDLYPQVWRALTAVEIKSASALQTPVSGGALHGDRCPWCGRLLGILYDLSLRDPGLAFLNLPGERLRFLTCEHCCMFAPIYLDDAFGSTARWSPVTEKPTYIDIDPDQEGLGWLEQRYVLGPLEHNPLEPLTSYGDLRDSRLGGSPNWVQYPEYPPCPQCRETMFCIGQINPGDVMYSAPEGHIYLFVCAECGKAASVQQQT